MRIDESKSMALWKHACVVIVREHQGCHHPIIGMMILGLAEGRRTKQSIDSRIVKWWRSDY
eukprot:scaffold11528_cov139-Cylindrotheca_fusiformis.AAC.3